MRVKLLLSVEEARDELGISSALIYELMRDGHIDYVRIGRRRFVRRDTLLDFIDARTVVSGGDAA